MNNFFEKIKSEESGQSLIEILIALTIGAILIGAASTAVVTVLQSGTTSQRQQTSTVLAQDYVEKTRSFASSDWHNLYNLQKSSSTLYQFEASSSQTIAIEGKEGVIDNDIRNGLAGYWSLDHATGTIAYDSSGEGNNGAINGASATSTDNCRVGRCYSFDGSSDYIDVSDDSSLNLTESFTISHWVKPRDTGDGVIIDKGSSYYRTQVRSNEFYFGMKDGTGNRYDITTSTVPVDEWSHLVAVWDSPDIDMYLNGELVHEDNWSFNPGTGGNLRIGSDAYDFNGYLDDVRIYNTALTQEDVNHLYNSAIFERYFYVENVCRTNDADYELAGVHPCDAGEVDDPSTQKVTVVVNWGNNGTFKVDDHITRWRNRTFPQTDWSGGSGSEGPFTEPTNSYSTSTDISTSSDGSINVEGI